MFGIVIGALISIVLFIYIGVSCTRQRNSTRKFVNAFSLLALLPIVLVLIISSIAIVPANNVGVVYSPFTGVKENTLSEGWYAKGVFDRVYHISTEVQTKTLTDISGQTKDSQYITMVVDVKYRVDSSKAFEVFRQYRNLKNISENLIAPTVQRSIEAVSTKYNIMEVLGERRNDLYREIEIDLKTRLALSGISFDTINFTDTDAGQAIEDAIQKEAIAKKAVETAEQERLKAEVEAQKRVVEAQADMDKAKIEAETKVIQAQAEADANKLLSQSITSTLLEKMEMEARLKHGWVTIQGGSVITDTRN